MKRTSPGQALASYNSAGRDLHYLANDHHRSSTLGPVAFFHISAASGRDSLVQQSLSSALPARCMWLSGPAYHTSHLSYQPVVRLRAREDHAWTTESKLIFGSFPPLCVSRASSERGDSNGLVLTCEVHAKNPVQEPLREQTFHPCPASE